MIRKRVKRVVKRREGLVRPDRTFVAKDRGYLSPEEREYFEKKAKNLEFTSQNIDNVIDRSKPWLYNPKVTNSGDLLKQARRARKTIEQRTAPTVDSKTKDLLWKRAKELERLIKNEMPTKDEMHGQRGVNSDGKVYYKETEGAVRKHIAWLTKQTGNINEWKQIMRTLEPNDPNVANIERLRKGH